MTARLLEDIESGKAFAICKLPGTNEVLEFFQNGNDLIDLSGRVWIAEPFDKDEKSKNQHESTSHSQHIAAVSKAVEMLHTAELDKVVISKIKKVDLAFSIDSESIQKAFELLSSMYPSAFVFIYRMNVHSVWLGATPETLIERNNGVFSTMSLAGTRLKSDHKVLWGEKEKREQQVVTDFITSSIQSNGGEELKVSEPFTASAAHLEHLKSTIEFHSSKSLIEWANVLHPTPAICGLPVAKAKNVISQIESHSRKMYSGFIGFLDMTGNGKVFVQLRCMEWLNGNAIIYSGGGIMPDSNPESEWEEAENKAKVMLSVLESLKN
jgi:isochorismate synthase